MVPKLASSAAHQRMGQVCSAVGKARIVKPGELTALPEEAVGFANSNYSPYRKV